MRINPFLNLKSSAAGEEVCSGDCGQGEGCGGGVVGKKGNKMETESLSS